MPLKSELISLEANRLLSLYYRESLEALARLAYKTKQAGILDLSKPIRWSDFPPERRREAEGILSGLHARLSNLYNKGTQSAWMAGERKVINQNRTLHMTPKARAKVNASNRYLLHELQNRKVGGLSVSSRVWGLIEDAEGKLELSLQAVLNDSKASRDPKALSRAFLRKLQNPDEVMKTLREGNQHETLQRAKQLFGRGVGIYRDPLKNIERLFRTEITKANREAQWQMFQQNPYITGFRIKRSGRLVDGKPLPCPLCEGLQGVYPKSFRFSVWHPHCECIMEPIFGSTKDPDFVAKVNQSASRGVDAVRKLENPEAIKEMPKEMLDFASRIQRSRSGSALITPAGKVPALFIQENAHLLRPHFATPSKANGKTATQSPAPQPTPPTALERSRLRQASRTPDQIAEIQRRWDERKKQQTLLRAKARQESRTPEQIQDIQKRWDERQASRSSFDYSKRDEALEYYISGNGMWINADLRAGTPLEPVEKRYLDNLTRITKLERVKQKVLWRALDAKAFWGDDMGEFEYEDLSAYMLYGDKSKHVIATANKFLNIKGKIFEDKGFMSTSKDEEFPVSMRTYSGAYHPVLMKIRTHQTTTGIDVVRYIKGTGELDAYEFQKEILLTRGQKYKVLNMSTYKGHICIEVELLPQAKEGKIGQTTQVGKEATFIAKGEKSSLAKEGLAYARANFIHKKVDVSFFDTPVTFTTRGIKEALNQPHKYIREKAEFIKNITEHLKTAEYSHSAPNMKHSRIGDKFHYLKTTIGGEDSYIVLVERNGKSGKEVIFYSIVDSVKK